jgi:hypothetical protein
LLKKSIIKLLESNPIDHKNLIHAGIFACEVTDYFIKKYANPPDTILCKAECPHCCEKAIPTITVPEAIYIHQYSVENGLKPNEYRAGACPFLNEKGSCSIHPARPVRCRGWNSTDLEFCKNPPDEFNIKDCAVHYPQFQAARKVHLALVGALEACGYINTLISIDDAFEDNWGVPAQILIEGLNMAMAGMA